MTTYERKQQIVIEQKQEKIEALIEGYKEILRQLNHNQKVAKTDVESTAYYTARNIVEEIMIEIADINVTDI